MIPNDTNYWNTGSDEDLSAIERQNEAAKVKPDEAAFLLSEAQKLAQWDGIERRSSNRRGGAA